MRLHVKRFFDCDFFPLCYSAFARRGISERYVSQVDTIASPSIGTVLDVVCGFSTSVKLRSIGKKRSDCCRERLPRGHEPAPRAMVDRVLFSSAVCCCRSDLL